MTFAEQLKGQLTDFVECYQKYFLKTFAVAMTFTVLCFVASVILVWLNTFGSDINFSGLLDLMFYRYSYKSYIWVDFAPLFSYFFVALFSLALFRHNAAEDAGVKEFTFNKFTETIFVEDIFVLLGTLALAWAIDFLLFRFSLLFHDVSTLIQNYVHNLAFHLRLFSSLILFAVAIHWLTNKKRLNVTLKEILCLFFTLWLFNQFILGFYLWIKYSLFDLLFLFVGKLDLVPLYQSILSIPILGFYFVGYYSALTWWLRTDNGEEPADNPETDMPAQ